MAENAIFYYPYASLGEKQSLLLRAAALYFDTLYILDPLKASWQSIGPGDAESDVKALADAGILVRISPEEVLLRFEPGIAAAIRDDLDDPGFVQLCGERGGNARWTLALAKVPEAVRQDPRYQPLDRSMQRLMGRDTPEGPGLLRYFETELYDEYREDASGMREYRYADYPLPIGEAIMLNHALFGGLLHTQATPITDEPFHRRMLSHKLERARQLPAIRDAIEDQARRFQVAHERLAMELLTHVPLGVIPPQMSIEQILEYRSAHGDELKRARERLAWTAARVKDEPLTDDFWNSVLHDTIPQLREEMRPAERRWTSWLKGAGIAAGVATIALSVVAVPLSPILLATAGVAVAKDVAIPGTEAFLDWKQGKRGAARNGLHYFIGLGG